MLRRTAISCYCRMWQEYVFTTSQSCFPTSKAKRVAGAGSQVHHELGPAIDLGNHRDILLPQRDDGSGDHVSGAQALR